MPQLDMFTLYLALLAACLALSLVWLVVARTFASIYAARYWFAGTLAVSAGAALSLSSSLLGPLVPLLLGNGLVLLGSGLGWAGVRNFSGRSIPWATILGVTAGAIAMLALIALGPDNPGLSIAVFSAAQSVLIGWAVVDILNRGKVTAGSLMAAAACAVLLIVNAARTILAIAAIGGELSAVTLDNPLQTALVLLLVVFAALVCQLGFLLMTMDRLQAEMAQLAGIDELTGAASRRRFIEGHARECSRSTRSGRTFSILLVDIDRFKSINDSHGHAAGDEFLKLFTRTALAQLRQQDLFARLHGDEFGVLMPETSGEQAAMIAGRLVQTVRELSLSRGGATVGSTISVGVAEWSPAIGGNADAMMELADCALYRAKDAGRDGVRSAPAAAPATPEPIAMPTEPLAA